MSLKMEFKEIIHNTPKEERPEKIKEFKARLVNHQELMAGLQEEVIASLKENPDLSKQEILDIVIKKGARAGISREELQDYNDTIEDFLKQREKFKKLRKENPDNRYLFEKVFGRQPKGEVTVVEGPFSLHFICKDPDDYAFTHEHSKGLERSSGVFVGGGITAEKGTDTEDSPELSEVIRKHEERHSIDSLIGNYGSYDFDMKSLEKASTPEQKEIALLRYFRNKRTSFEERAASEIRSYISDSNDGRENIFETLVEEGGLYDYKSEKEFKEGLLTDKLLAPYKDIFAQTFEKVFVKEYKEIISDGIRAINNLMEKGYTKEGALAALQTEPLFKWKKISERLIENSTSNIQVQKKIKEMNLSREDLEKIEGFHEIGYSEGKILNVLENLDQLRLRNIDTEAKDDSEKHIREGKGFFQKTWRRIIQGSDIEKRRREYAKKKFDINLYKKDVEDLMYISSMGPEISVEGIGEYVGFKSFDIAATAYSKIPPEAEWQKYPKKQKAEFEAVKKSYEERRAEYLSKAEGSEKEKMLKLNDVEFILKTQQTIVSHYGAELELKKLAEEKEWRRDWSSFGDNTGRNVASFTASALASAAGAASMPLAILAASGIGYWRGGEKAKDRLNKEEELMKIGEEGRTMSQMRITGLLHKRAEIISKLAKASSEKKKASLTEKVKAIDLKLAEIREKSTDSNIVSSDKMIEKLKDASQKLNRSYREYLLSGIKHPKTVEEFLEDKKKIAEQLSIRMEYIKRKLDEGKISFGKPDESLVKKYDLLVQMSDASSDVFSHIDFDDKKISEKFGNARRSRLEKTLLGAEMRIRENKDKYIKSQSILGAVTGGLFAGAGYQVGHMVSESFGSHIAHAVHEKALSLRSAGDILNAQQLEGSFGRMVSAAVSHSELNRLIG